MAVGVSVKLTEEQKKAILQLCGTGTMTYRQIGEIYGISGARIGQIYNENNKQTALQFKEKKPRKKHNIKKGNYDRTVKHKTRKQSCLKCHKTFITELDKMGIPFQKICPKCHEENKRMSGNFDRGVHKSSSRNYRED